MARKTLYSPPFLVLQGGQAALGNCSATTAAAPSSPAVKKNGLCVLGFPGSLGGGTGVSESIPTKYVSKAASVSLAFQTPLLLCDWWSK